MRLILFSPPTTLPHEHATLQKLAARARAASSTASAGVAASPPSSLLLPAAFHVRKPGADEASVEDYLKRLPRELLERAVLHSHHGLADKFEIKGIHFTEAARKALPGGTGRPPRGSNQRRIIAGQGRGSAAAAALTLSTSLHSCAEVEAEARAAAKRKKEGNDNDNDNKDSDGTLPYDYVFLSPLFESISKPGYGGRGQEKGTEASSSPSSQFWDEEGRRSDKASAAAADATTAFDLEPSRRLKDALSSARASGLGVVALGGIDSPKVRFLKGELGLFLEGAAVLGAVWGRGEGADDAVGAWEELVAIAAAAAAAAASSSSASP